MKTTVNPFGDFNDPFDGVPDVAQPSPGDAPSGSTFVDALGEAVDSIGPAGFAMIDDFLIDCTIREEHTLDSEVSKYPVEGGGTITDNIRKLPADVLMECIVSNAPIGEAARYRKEVDGLVDQLLPAGTNRAFSTPAAAAYARLERIRDQRLPVTIRTSLKTYPNMALEKLSIPTSSEQGDALYFTARFTAVEIVENKRTTRVSTPIARGGKRVVKSGVPIDVDMSKIGGIVLVDTFRQMWWDDDIKGWRERAYSVSSTLYQLNDGSNLPSDVLANLRSTKKLWHLSKGRPEHYSPERWNTPNPNASGLLPIVAPGDPALLVHPDDKEVKFTNEGIALGKPPTSYSPYIVALLPGEYVRD